MECIWKLPKVLVPVLSTFGSCHKIPRNTDLITDRFVAHNTINNEKFVISNKYAQKQLLSNKRIKDHLYVYESIESSMAEIYWCQWMIKGERQRWRANWNIFNRLLIWTPFFFINLVCSHSTAASLFQTPCSNQSSPCFRILDRLPNGGHLNGALIERFSGDCCKSNVL